MHEHEQKHTPDSTRTHQNMYIRRLTQRSAVEQLHNTLLPIEQGAQRSHQKNRTSLETNCAMYLRISGQ